MLTHDVRRPRDPRHDRSGARIRLAGALFLVLVLGPAACASFYAQADYDPGVDFTRLRSYAWVPRTLTTAPRDPRIDNELLDARIRRSVDSTLAEKGYTLVPAGGAPDFKMNYQIAIEQKFDVQSIPSTYGYGLGWWGGPGYADVYVDEYEQGTLFLDVIDAKSNSLVWRGHTAGRVLPDLSPGEREQRALDAVRAILEKFPPPAR